MGFLGFGENNISLLKKLIRKFGDLITAIKGCSAPESIKNGLIRKHTENMRAMVGFEAEFMRGEVSLKRKQEIREELNYRENEIIPKRRDITNQWFFDLSERERMEITAILSDIDQLSIKLNDKLK